MNSAVQSLPARYRVMMASEIMALPPLQWRILNVLPAEGAACIFGASGSGKSFLTLDLCAAVASGTHWFGYRVNAAPVVYLALEGEAGFGQRLKAWKFHNGKEPPSALRFIAGASFDLRRAEDLKALIQAVRASGSAGGVLVIDTLNRAANGADENTSKDMGHILRGMKQLQSALGGLILAVHHSGKDQSRGLRGHSSLNAALDASIEVVKLDGRREWRLDKAKDNAADAIHAFRLQVVDVGLHPEGEPITSCAVLTDDSVKQIRKATPPRSGNQKIAWDTLKELLSSADRNRPPDAPASLPLGCPAIALEAAIGAVRDRLVCKPKRKTERAQQALNGLNGRGLIRVDRGYVWTA